MRFPMASANSQSRKINTNRQTGLVNLPQVVLRPLPLFILQPLLSRIVREAIRKRPELFRRLGVHQNKLYFIDPLNLPFALLLLPNASSPRLRAVRRRDRPFYDARIAGTFLTLLDMVDGQLDGDALFFSRDLVVEGDTEAVIVLRNALDDLEGSIADTVAEFFGLTGQLALARLRRIRKRTYEQRSIATT